MPRFSFELENTTPATAATSAPTINASVASLDVLMEAMITGLAAAAAINRQGIQRATTNGATPTNGTLTKLNPQSQSALVNVVTAWGTGPTLSGNNILDLGVQCFGGVKRWVVYDVMREGVWLVGPAGAGSQQAAFIAAAANGAQNIHLLIEEA